MESLDPAGLNEALWDTTHVVVHKNGHLWLTISTTVVFHRNGKTTEIAPDRLS